MTRVIVLDRMTYPQQRQLYRIIYPIMERPTFESGRFVHEVLDCSEKGLRYEMKEGTLPLLAAQVAGVLHFRRGDDVEVEGEVLRSGNGIVVLTLTPPLPFAEIMAEQRYLRSKGYPLKG